MAPGFKKLELSQLQQKKALKKCLIPKPWAVDILIRYLIFITTMSQTIEKTVHSQIFRIYSSFTLEPLLERIAQSMWSLRMESLWLGN